MLEVHALRRADGPTTASTERFTACTASGPFLAMTSAQRRASAITSDGGDDSVDETDPLRLGRRKLLAHEEDLHRVAERDLPREPDRRAAHREEAVLHLGDREAGVVGGDPDVGRLQDLGAPGDAKPLALPR